MNRSDNDERNGPEPLVWEQIKLWQVPAGQGGRRGGWDDNERCEAPVSRSDRIGLKLWEPWEVRHLGYRVYHASTLGALSERLQGEDGAGMQ